MGGRLVGKLGEGANSKRSENANMRLVLSSQTKIFGGPAVANLLHKARQMMRIEILLCTNDKC
jgi:hypothetical protein